MLKLRYWINIDKLDWRYLSGNPNTIELLKENKDIIDWKYLLYSYFIFHLQLI
jgi:hypothetical protein